MEDPTDYNLNYLIEERFSRDVIASCILDSVRSVRNMLHQIGCRICDSEFEQFEEIQSNSEDVFENLVVEMASICQIGNLVQSKFSHYEETRKKERREHENNIFNLREENRDISRLLKIAIIEKEAMEKRSKITSGENKRGTIMQIAEKGLQKVGFGFVMGVLSGDPQPDPVYSSCSSTDASDAEEDTFNLNEAVENIMKNLRTEINYLRISFHDSRLANENLQALVDEQVQKLKKNEKHIKDSEEREIVLSNSVEELSKEMKIAGEEITRWREACQLEVEAGKSAIKERDNELSLIKDELEQTKKSLEESNNKLQLKERLATTAMAAQSAAATCLRLADCRSANLQDRIEELTKQLEEKEEERERGRAGAKRARYMCWPLRGLRIPRESIRMASWRIVGTRRRSVPEMEALLRIRI